MDRRPNRHTTPTLYAPTDLIVGAFRLKDIVVNITRERRKSLRDVLGPALEFRDQTVVGEAAILGWADRRYPYPALFPSDLELYARASTLAHALGQDPELATLLIAAHDPHDSYLLGCTPNIADLALWSALTRLGHPEANRWADKLFSGADL